MLKDRISTTEPEFRGRWQDGLVASLRCGKQPNEGRGDLKAHLYTLV